MSQIGVFYVTDCLADWMSAQEVARLVLQLLEHPIDRPFRLEDQHRRVLAAVLQGHFAPLESSLDGSLDDETDVPNDSLDEASSANSEPDMNEAVTQGTPTDQSPSEEPPTDQSPTEQPPTDQAPTEEPPATVGWEDLNQFGRHGYLAQLQGLTTGVHDDSDELIETDWGIWPHWGTWSNKCLQLELKCLQLALDAWCDFTAINVDVKEWFRLCEQEGDCPCVTSIRLRASTATQLANARNEPLSMVRLNPVIKHSLEVGIYRWLQ